MKKYIFTENQIKNVIKMTINEQEEEIKLHKGVQCFLNKRFNANIAVDGDHGEETSKLIKKIQNIRKVYPVDGKWGSETRSKLTPQEIEMLDDCTASQGDFIDKGIRSLSKLF
jgi:hypothetical protein